jgi:nucleotide-binding universal stress UspA family protein
MNRFKNILYVTETTMDQVSAVARAVSLAENNQANLTIIDVISPVADSHKGEAMAGRMKALETLVQPYQHRLKIQLDVLMGRRVFIEVIRAVLRNGYDLVIKAEENPNFLKRLFGSDDVQLLRKCPCPLWLMKLPENPNYKCIVAAVDFDPMKSTAVEQDLNQEILELASSLAISDFAALHLAHAWKAFAEKTMHARGVNTNTGIVAHVEKEYLLHQNGLYKLSEALKNRIGKDAYTYLSPDFHLPKGSAKKMIPALAADLKADLVVMGTAARTGIAGIVFGNTAEAILDHLKCSLLVIKPSDFKTP